MKKTVVMMCAAAGVCVAQGAPFEDKFETYNVGSNIGGNNGWVDVFTTAEQGFTVAAVNSDLSEGGKAMYISDATQDAALNDARLSNVFSKAMKSASITFDFMATTSLQTPIVTIRGGAVSTSPQAVAMTISPGGAGYINYHDGTTWQNFAAGLKTDTWYRFTITITDVATRTFDLVVLDKKGEVLNKKGLIFRTAVSGLASIDFATNSGFGKSGGDYYVDNVQILPAPAAVGM
jgi:hypothetical protein